MTSASLSFRTAVPAWRSVPHAPTLKKGPVQRIAKHSCWRASFLAFCLGGRPAMYTMYIPYISCVYSMYIYTTIHIFGGPPAMSKTRPPTSMVYSIRPFNEPFIMCSAFANTARNIINVILFHTAQTTIGQVTCSFFVVRNQVGYFWGMLILHFFVIT